MKSSSLSILAFFIAIAGCSKAPSDAQVKDIVTNLGNQSEKIFYYWVDESNLVHRGLCADPNVLTRQDCGAQSETLHLDALGIRLNFLLSGYANLSKKELATASARLSSALARAKDLGLEVQSLEADVAKLEADLKSAEADATEKHKRVSAYDDQIKAIDQQLAKTPDDADLITLRAQVASMRQPFAVADAAARAVLLSAQTDLGNKAASLATSRLQLEKASTEVNVATEDKIKVETELKSSTENLAALPDTIKKLRVADLPYTMLESNALFSSSRGVVRLFNSVFEMPRVSRPGTYSGPGLAGFQVKWSEDKLLFGSEPETFVCSDGVCRENNNPAVAVVTGDQTFVFSSDLSTYAIYTVMERHF